MTSRAIMVQGTASSVGKSIVVTALCRLLRQEGLRVAPFKAQNMALNAFVTQDGREIGRAQAVQAAAAGVTPTVDMNPILLKPEGDARSQVVVLGRPTGSLDARSYQERKPALRALVREALARLRAAHDVVVIEGAGSPAEINLKERDLVNMFVADAADCKVILVGDIDRGGVLAAFVGTMELLDPHERARVGAFLVNKFRGDVGLLEPGLRFLETRTGVPVLGVLPYVRRLRIADEDSVSLDERPQSRRAGPGEVEVAVVRTPRLSNHDDFQPLEHEPGVVLRFVEHACDVGRADLVILPGSKSTVADLRWLRDVGLADAIAQRARGGRPILGICGGCQMLGQTIADPEHVESGEALAMGLGLLPLATRFSRHKRTAQVRARPLAGWPRHGSGKDADGEVTGYEIHMGRIERIDDAQAAFALLSRNGLADDALDGGIAADGAVVGTMLHGLFENQSMRNALVTYLRERKGLAKVSQASSPEPAAGDRPAALPDDRGLLGNTGLPDEYDRLATVLRENVDVALLHRLLGPP